MTENIDSKIANLLITQNKTLSVAESCTGGLVSSMLTDVSGSSGYTKINFVTYSNEAKQKYLGVSTQTLNTFGAVSEQTAMEMAQCLIKITGADFALSTTGIAGPTGGSPEKPIGLIFIGVASKNNVSVLKYNANPSLERKTMKKEFAKKALDFLYDYMTGV